MSYPFFHSNEPWNITEIRIGGKYVASFDQVFQSEVDKKGTFDQVIRFDNYIGSFDQVLHYPTLTKAFDQVITARLRTTDPDRAETLRTGQLPENIDAYSACTHDSQLLYLVNKPENQATSNLYIIETYSFKILSTIQLPSLAVGITYDSQYKYIIYENDLTIYRVNPYTGQIVSTSVDNGMLDLTSLLPNSNFIVSSGICYNSQKDAFFVLDDLFNLYEIPINRNANSQATLLETPILRASIPTSAFGGIENDGKFILVCNNETKKLFRYTTDGELLESFLVPLDTTNISDIGFNGFYGYTIHVGSSSIREVDIIADPSRIITTTSVPKVASYKTNFFELQHEVYDRVFGVIRSSATQTYNVQKVDLLDLVRTNLSSFRYYYWENEFIRTNYLLSSLTATFFQQPKENVTPDPDTSIQSKLYTIFDKLNDSPTSGIETGIVLNPGEVFEVILEQEVLLEAVTLDLQISNPGGFDTIPLQKVYLEYTPNNVSYTILTDFNVQEPVKITISDFLETGAQNVQLLNFRIRSDFNNNRPLLLKGLEAYEISPENLVTETQQKITDEFGETSFFANTPVFQASRNLVMNPGFYDGLNNWVLNSTNSTASAFVSSNNNILFPEDRWRLTLVANSTSSIQLTSDLIPVEQDENYTFSCYVQSTNLSSTSFVGIEWRNAAGLLIDRSLIQNLTNVYSRKSFTVRTPDEASFANVIVFADSPGSIIEVNNFQLERGINLSTWGNTDSKKRYFKTVVEF